MYSEPYQISKTEFFTKIVDSRETLIILGKQSTLDVWQGLE